MNTKHPRNLACLVAVAALSGCSLVSDFSGITGGRDTGLRIDAGETIDTGVPAVDTGLPVDAFALVDAAQPLDSGMPMMPVDAGADAPGPDAGLCLATVDQSTLDPRVTHGLFIVDGDWQSVDVTRTGSLTRLVVRSISADVDVVVNVYAGVGIDGPRIGSGSATILDPGERSIQFTPPIAVMAGIPITFVFNSSSPSGVRLGLSAAQPYPAESMIQASSSEDIWLRTYVKPCPP